MNRLTTDSDGAFAPGKLAAAVAGVAFLATVVVLAVLQAGLAANLAAAAVVAGATAVVIYALLLVPLRTHLEERLARARSEVVAEPADPSIDPLTHALSRRGITVALLELMALADRYNHKLSIAMVAIDRLEQINLEQGEAVGDELLVAVAEALADTLRMPDRVGRYSGNAFLLVLPETALPDACKLAERIRALAEHVSVGEGEGHVVSTLSIGVTDFRRGEDLELVVSRAERAIVEARGKGYNSVVCAQAA